MSRVNWLTSSFSTGPVGDSEFGERPPHFPQRQNRLRRGSSAEQLVPLQSQIAIRRQSPWNSATSYPFPGVLDRGHDRAGRKRSTSIVCARLPQILVRLARPPHDLSIRRVLGARTPGGGKRGQRSWSGSLSIVHLAEYRCGTILNVAVHNELMERICIRASPGRCGAPSATSWRGRCNGKASNRLHRREHAIGGLDIACAKHSPSLDCSRAGRPSPSRAPACALVNASRGSARKRAHPFPRKRQRRAAHRDLHPVARGGCRRRRRCGRAALGRVSRRTVTIGRGRRRGGKRTVPFGITASPSRAGVRRAIPAGA